MGIPLKRSKKVKYLGVIFDQKMQWEDHIKNVNQKILFKYSKIKSHCIIFNTPYKTAFNQCTSNAIFKLLLLSMG